MSFIDLRPDQFKTDEPENKIDWLGVLGVFFVCFIVGFGGCNNQGISDCEAENIRSVYDQADHLKSIGQGEAGTNLKHNARRIAKGRC
jgi:hypothetical protein